MQHLEQTINILAQEDKLEAYEQELLALLQDLRNWREEAAKNPQKSQGILEAIDKYMHDLGTGLTQRLDQTVSKSIEEQQWEEAKKYIEMSGSNY